MKETGKKNTRIRKLSIQITNIFFGITITFLGILILSAYIIFKTGIFSFNKYAIIFLFFCALAWVCMILASTASFFMVKKIFTPLETLSEASKQVAKGDFNIELKYQGHLEELENTIDNFNRMVKELNSVEIMRNDFMADVSHEFKTPLAAITGYMTFLQDEDLSREEKDEYIQKIFFHIDKLNELIENILQLSKLEHQQFLKEPIEYRLDEQLREAIVLLEPKWGRKRINFELDLPEVLYRGQKGLLFQVWTNIIGNAIKYTDENGSIEVLLKEADNVYEIIIKDNGVGMTDETIKHIFEKFYQADTSRKAQGNGLGLSLCKEIIHKCEGSIGVESKYGEGSKFVIALPKIEDSQRKLKLR